MRLNLDRSQVGTRGQLARVVGVLLLAVALVLSNGAVAQETTMDMMLAPAEGPAADQRTAKARQPNLIRLAFWVPPERMDAFALAFQEQVVPVVERLGLTLSERRGRATPDSVFSRLFESALPLAAPVHFLILIDSTATVVWRALGREFGTTWPDDHIRMVVGNYEVAAGKGSRATAGKGRITTPQGTGHWRHFDREEGLAGTRVKYIAEDRNGHIWLGGWEQVGVSRYDGERFTNYTTDDGLIDTRVGSLIHDRAGHIWIGTRYGVSRYDGTGFVNYTTENGLAVSLSMPHLEDRAGNIWFGTWGGGATRFDGQTFSTFRTGHSLAENVVTNILEDVNGHIWLGWYGGSSRYDGESFAPLPMGRRIIGRLLLADRNGVVWGANWRPEGGVAAYDGSGFRTLTKEDGLPSNSVMAMMEDAEGWLWFATSDGGISRYDGERFYPVRRDLDRSGAHILTMYEDSRGYLWLGTSAGISRHDEEFTTFSSADGLGGDVVGSVFVDREGVLWIGSGVGALSRFDGRVMTTYTVEDGLGEYRVGRFMQDRAGNIWFGTDRGGAVRFDGNEFVTLSMVDGLASNQVGPLMQDGQGDFWFGTHKGPGLTRYDGKSITAYTTADGLGRFTSNFGLNWVQNNVVSMLEDRNGVLWFGAESGGVNRFDGERIQTLTTRDGLASNTIVAVAEDNEGHLWFGSSMHGISRWDGASMTTLTPSDGLPDAVVRALFCDARGHLWIGTAGAGASRYDGKTFQRLTTDDGLASNAVSSIAQDRDGNMWFGTDNGLTRFVEPPPSSPAVAVDAVVAEHRHEGVSELSLASTVGLVAFEVSGGNFKTRPEAVVFRYRLHGQDSEWKTTRNRRIEYDDLLRGEYVFEVEAVDRDLVYSDTPATVRLTLHWPYERAAWAAAMMVAVVLIAWQTSRVVRRDRRLQESNRALATANEELEQATQHKSDFLARMSHDLRTPMNAIIGYTRILLRRSKDVLEDRQYRNLENIQVSADHLLALINDILDLSKIEAGRMEVNLEVVELPALVNECASAVESLVNPGVELVREVEEMAPVQTDADRLRRVVMNLLSNAVKFTEEGSITVGLREVNGQLELSVADTGVGIPEEEQGGIFDEFSQVAGSGEAKQGSGLGLAIAKKSVELLGGSIAVDSEVGVGTTFRVRLEGGLGQ